jgi:enterochelin esterase-like enzyme
VVSEACVCLSFCLRSDAAQWPGGGVAAYLARIQQEVLPWVAREYGASLNPNDLALAGSSFGGVAALAAGMSSGGQGGGCAFGALLVESPSMWIADEAFLKVGGGTPL